MAKVYLMKNYLIERGAHRSKFWPRLSKKNLRFFARIVCAPYDLGSDQSDWNKLYGIRFSWWDHKNSIRIGWRYIKENGKLELAMYAYSRGQRRIVSLGFVQPGEEWFECEIKQLYRDKNVSNYLVAVNGNRTYVEAAHTGWPNFRLFPYFGGSQPAPHRIKIQIDDII